MSYMRILILVLCLLIPLTACGRSPEEARTTLGQMNIRYSADEFVNYVRQGDLVVVRLFLESGMDVNVQTKSWRVTVLPRGREFTDSEASRIKNTLLSMGASKYGGNLASVGSYVLFAIGSGTSVDLERYRDELQGYFQVGKNNVTLNTVDGFTALIWASYEGHMETVKLLLSKGADVKAKNSEGVTALTAASFSGHLETVKLLLSKGADVNAKNSEDLPALIPALIPASSGGHLEIVKLLLSKGADVNAKNSNGWTALLSASSGGHLEIVKLLLSKGADVNAKPSDGRTALMRASERGHLEVVELLKA